MMSVPMIAWYTAAACHPVMLRMSLVKNASRTGSTPFWTTVQISDSERHHGDDEARDHGEGGPRGRLCDAFLRAWRDQTIDRPTA